MMPVRRMKEKVTVPVTGIGDDRVYKSRPRGLAPAPNVSKVGNLGMSTCFGCIHLNKNSTRRAERTRMRYETLIHFEV